MKLDPYFLPLTKNSSKWMEDLNIRPETIKIVVKNTGKTIRDLGVCKGNLKKTSKAQAIVLKIDKWE